jgi:hypothetical protein
MLAFKQDIKVVHGLGKVTYEETERARDPGQRRFATTAILNARQPPCPTSWSRTTDTDYVYKVC